MISPPPQKRFNALTIFLIAVILLLGIVLMRFVPGFQNFPFSVNTAQVPSPTAVVQTLSPTVPVRERAYTAPVPGEGCDIHGATWTIATLIPDPKDENREITENNTTATCQKNGLLVASTKHSGYASTIHFDGPPYQGNTYAFPPDYQVQVDAAIQQGTPDAVVDLTVQWQKTGFGHYSLTVNSVGEWEIYRADSHNQADKRLATGTLQQPAKSFTLAAEIHPALMLFSINGTRIATITDSAYTTTTSISFGIWDVQEASKLPSALFSNFSYQALLPSERPAASVTSACLQQPS